MWHSLLVLLLAVPQPKWQSMIGFEKSAKTPTQEFAHALFVRPDGTSVVLCQSAGSDSPPGGKSGFSFTWIGSDGKPLRTAWTGYHEGDVYSAYELPKGGFLLTGSLGGVDTGLARFDAQGKKLWAKSYEWREGTQGIGFVRMQADGSYLVQFGPHLAHIDDHGTLLESQEINDEFHVLPFAFREDGGYFGVRSVGGDTPLPDNATYQQRQAVAAKRDLEVARFDPHNRLLWRKTYGGNQEDSYQTVLVTPDGGCLVAGNTRSLGVKHDSYYFLRLDEQGGKLWEKALPAAKESEFLSSCVLTPDGGFAALGTRGLVKFTATGGKQWEKTYPGSATWLAATPDGGFLLAGSLGRSDADSWFDLYLAKTDGQGNTGPKPKPIKL